ncbi:MAG: transposase [Kiritimatiellia bacterium]
MSEPFRKKPPRLPFVHQQYQIPLYFITFNAWQRQAILANQSVFDAFVEYAELNALNNRAIGKFVIMPDHIHLFVCLDPDYKLATFIRLLKQALSKIIKAEHPEITRVWQPGFFDHLIRSNESYAEKWSYVNDNPVRKLLVERAEEWPWSGEIVRIDRV